MGPTGGLQSYPVSMGVGVLLWGRSHWGRTNSGEQDVWGTVENRFRKQFPEFEEKAGTHRRAAALVEDLVRISFIGADFQSSIERWDAFLGRCPDPYTHFGGAAGGMRIAPASRSAGILPALANEEGKGGTLAAILSHPIGRWARRPTLLDLPLARHLGQPAITGRYVYNDQGNAQGNASHPSTED